MKTDKQGCPRAHANQSRFAVDYSVRHIRRLIEQMGFSVQRPKRVLARAAPAAKHRWRRYTKKKPVRKDLG